MINNANLAYQNNQIFTAKPEELTLMLYGGALKFIRQSKKAIQNREFDKAKEANYRAQDIVSELMATLNFDYDISRSLFQLYEYAKWLLNEGQNHKKIEQLEEAEHVIVSLKQTWEDVMKQKKGN